MMSPHGQPQPLAPPVAPRPAAAGRLLPFALPAVLGLALLAGPLTPPGHAPLWTAAGVVLAVLAGLAAALLPWGRWPPWLNDLPPLGFATGVLLLRYGVNQPAWNVSPLLLLPAFWLALYGRPLGLMAMLALLAVAGLVPDFFLPRTEAISPPVVLGFVTLGALFLTVQRLVREQQRRTVSLQQQLRLDPLTGAGNRTGWDEALTRELARARRNQEPICLAVIDLDHFKRVNDQFGHAAGMRYCELVFRDGKESCVPVTRWHVWAVRNSQCCCLRAVCPRHLLWSNGCGPPYPVPQLVQRAWRNGMVRKPRRNGWSERMRPCTAPKSKAEIGVL